MRYRLLGQLEVVTDDGRVVAFAGDKERVVLAALLLGAGRVVSTSRLIDAVWGEDPPVRAANALQVHVSRLRKKLAALGDGREVLFTEPSGYRLRVAPGELDVARFEELVALTPGAPEEVSSRLAEALALWRGPPLWGAASDTLAGEAVRLEELRLVALERRIEADLALGRHLELVPELEAGIADHPLREGFRRQLMVALYRCNRQADALALYRQTRDLLADQLGIDPSPSLQSLELAILTQSPELEPPIPVVGSARAEALPSGTVTFLFSDIEGSTRLLRELGSDRYAETLAEHRARVREVVAAHHGAEVGTEGDALFEVFDRASDALAAALAIQERLATGPVRVRIGLHTGEPLSVDQNYVGLDVHLAARICSAGHGGQVLVSSATARLARHVLPPQASLADRGEFLFHGLDEPERVYQLLHPALQASFPPLGASPTRSHNLPDTRTSFVGRDTELKLLDDLLSTARLVSVVGPGGSGKTRLALQVAAGQLERFEDGVWLVELASLRDPGLVASAVADALGVREQAGRPVLATLLDALGHRSPLVVLDNCEHLIEACARVAEALLGAGPGLHVLATSRELLGVDGEQVFRLGPLTTPVADDEALEPGQLAKSDAVALFVERAAAQSPGFVLDGSTASAVARVCMHLDGIPLALELAAARLRSMSVHDIEARLADRFAVLAGARRTAPPRHQTLEALIGWSYDLLSPTERTVFARLAVFAGGWRLDQAEQVCAGGAVTTAEVAGLLAALVDKSLVEVEPTGPAARYRLLETVRQYADRRLAEAGEAERTARAHARAYLALSETVAPLLRGQAQAEWLVRIDEDLDNIRVAAATLLAAPDGADEALRLVRAQRWYGDLRPRYREDIELAEAALGLPGADAPTLLRAQALVAWLSLKVLTGDLAMVGTRADEGLAIARAHGDTPTVVDLLMYRVFGASCQGDRSPEVMAMARECTELARQCGDPHLAGRAWCMAQFELEPYLRLEFIQQAVAWLRSTGDRHWLSIAINNLSDEETQLGDLDAAKAHLDEAIAMRESLGGENQSLSVLHFNCGLVSFLNGDAGGAAAHFSTSFAVAERVGARRCQAFSVFGLAWCASTRGEAARAAYLHGTAAAVSEQLGVRSGPLEAGITESDICKLQEELGPEAFEGAFNSGVQLARTWWQVDSRTREAAIFSTRPPGQVHKP